MWLQIYLIKIHIANNLKEQFVSPFSKGLLFTGMITKIEFEHNFTKHLPLFRCYLRAALKEEKILMLQVDEKI